MKGFSVMVYLEHVFYLLLTRLCKEYNCSRSAYLRYLLIEDLERKGLITNEVLKEAVKDVYDRKTLSL